MALADSYSQLQTDILNWTDRQDLSSRATDFITLGEARLYRELRIRAMKDTNAAAISGGLYSLPSDYIELINVRVVSGSEEYTLERVSSEQIYASYPTRTASGMPKYFSVGNASIAFGPYPDSDYTIKISYYKRLPALSGSNTTNWFTSNAPDILFFACMVEAWDFIGDIEEREKYELKYQTAKNRLQREDKRERVSGGPVRSISR